MALSRLNPRFAYTVVYVKDVAESVEFHSKAFGYSARNLDYYKRWGELESGQNTLAFTPLRHLPEHKKNIGFAVCFVYPDVDAAIKVEKKRNL